MSSSWTRVGIVQLEEAGVIQLGRGKVISKKDLAANPGTYPVYSSAKQNDGKFGEYGDYMFDEELVTWSVDGGGSLFHRPRHRFSITNVGGFIRILDNERVYCRFMFFALSYLHSQVSFDWVRKAHPSVIRKVYTDFPLPPLEEQKRIVAVLDQAFAALDRANANVEANLTDAKEVFDSWLASTYSNREEEWPHTTLPDICINLDRQRIPITKKDRVEGQVPYYGASGVVDYVADFIFDEDLLLVSEDGANLLARTYPIAFSISGKSWVNNHAHVLRFENRTDQEFVRLYLESISLNPFVSGMAQPKLNQKALNSIPVPFPDIEERASVVSKAKELGAVSDQARRQYEAQMHDIEGLRQSILQNAFAGELT